MSASLAPPIPTETMRRRSHASIAFLVTAGCNAFGLRGNDNVLNALLRMTEALPSEARHETRAGVILPDSGCRFRNHHALSQSCGRCDEDGELDPIDGSSGR